MTSIPFKAFVADGAKERIVVLTPNTASARQCREGHLPADPLRVRLIRVELESGEVEVLITSLLDTKAYPYRAFAKLYALRWGIEENYKREKQRLEIENFSGRSPWVLLQDFHAKIFAQNLTAIFCAWPSGWRMRVTSIVGTAIGSTSPMRCPR